MIVLVSVTVNGREHRVPAGTTLSQLVHPLTSQPTGVAAAVDGVVVPRRQWDGHEVADGSRIEVLVAVQGG